MKIILREEAKNLGLIKYFTGKLCKHGHLSERYISGDCVECRPLKYASYRANNLERLREYDKKRSKLNSEKRRKRERIRRSKWSTEKRKEICLATRNWYATNTEKARARALAYQKSHPDEVRARNMARHALKYKALPIWANKKKIKEFYRKARNLKESTGIPHHVDHIYPLKSPIVCGLHTEHNLQVIPALDNIRKGNRISEY